MDCIIAYVGGCAVGESVGTYPRVRWLRTSRRGYGPLSQNVPAKSSRSKFQVIQPP